MDKKLLSQFSVTPYGETRQFDSTKSLGRCRIFYRGKNRNGSFISDEFADKLVATLPYTPVKGIYEDEDKDFAAHSTPSEGRIYGVVPEKNNFAWEKHLDDDGVERDYACTDVIYYTALYDEAGEINNKSQSMELYRPSIQGEWQVIDGDEYFVFKDASFLGLQVLGEKVEPCFEGAAFFSLYEDLIKKIEAKEAEEEKNAEFSAEEAPVETVDAPVEEEVPAEEAPIETAEETPVEAEENAEADAESAPTEEEPEAPADPVEDEAAEVPEVSENTLNEGVVETVSMEEFQKAGTKISELEESISTLTMERDSAFSKVTELENRVQELTALCETLSAFKKSIEDAKKLAVINEYTERLSEEVLETYRANLDKYSEEDLDMHLFYEMKKASPSIFSSSNDQGITLIPKNGQSSEKSSIERILDRYEKH